MLVIDRTLPGMRWTLALSGLFPLAMALAVSGLRSMTGGGNNLDRNVCSGQSLVFGLLLFFVLPGASLTWGTCNRRTWVDPAERQIFSLDTLFFFVPVWYRRIRFSEVTSVEYSRYQGYREDDNDPPKETLIVSIVRGKRRLTIMERYRPKKFDEALAQANEIAHLLGLPIQQVDSPVWWKKT